MVQHAAGRAKLIQDFSRSASLGRWYAIKSRNGIRRCIPTLRDGSFPSSITWTGNGREACRNPVACSSSEFGVQGDQRHRVLLRYPRRDVDEQAKGRSGNRDRFFTPIVLPDPPPFSRPIQILPIGMPCCWS